MRESRTAALPALLLSMALEFLAVPAAEADARFAVSRPDLITRIRTIGLMPLEIEEAIPNPDEVAARLEGLVTERLQTGGFTVVAASDMRAIRARALASLGGLYDPMTGLPNRERLAALQEFSSHEYRMQHPVDATLRVSIVRRRARFAMGWFGWDGVRERVSSKSGLADVMVRGMETGIQPGEDVPALSLAVRLVDAHGETVYAAVGGLLLLAYPTTESGTLLDYDLGAVDPRFSLGDPAIGRRALAVALDPLATGAVPHKSLEFRVPQPKDSPTRPATLPELRRDHRRLALATLEMPAPPIEQGERVQARYRELLTAKFAALGLEVVGNKDFDALWAAERSAAGGFYDPITGLPDLGKVNRALARVLTTLRERYDAAGVIMPSIVLRQAPFNEGYAHWDGVGESVTSGGSFLFNGSIFNPNTSYAGQLEANSLRLRILDGTGRVLYQGLGGVQLTMHLDHGRPVVLAESTLYADPTRDADAANVALHELAKIPPQRP